MLHHGLIEDGVSEYGSWSYDIVIFIVFSSSQNIVIICDVPAGLWCCCRTVD